MQTFFAGFKYNVSPFFVMNKESFGMHSVILHDVVLFAELTETNDVGQSLWVYPYSPIHAFYITIVMFLATTPVSMYQQAFQAVAQVFD